MGKEDRSAVNLWAASGAGLVGGLLGGVLVARWNGADLPLGTLAEWATAVGTVGALGLTYRLLSHEVAARRADERRRAESQARLVRVIGGRATQGQFDPATGGYSPPMDVDITASVVNNSSELIRDIDLVVQFGSEQLDEHGEIVAPEHVFSARWKRTWPDEVVPEVTASATFTDADGGRWRRTQRGDLTPMSS